MLNLNNKKIIVTGASGELGRSTAIKLSKLGAQLVITGRSKERLDDTLNLLEGTQHKAIVCDFSEISNIQNMMKEAIAFDSKKLNGIAFCSGVIPVRPVKNTTEDFLHEIMKVNFYSFVELVRLYSQRNYSNGGSIVAISSYASYNGSKGQLAYSASKGAIDSSIVVMAKEYYAKNIRINSIRPAILESSHTNIETLSNDTKIIIEKMQTGMIDINNIAEQVAFLLSDNSSGVYGRHFDVKGYLS